MHREVKRVAKRILSVFLSFVLVFGMLPVVGASAEDSVSAFPDMPDNWATKALESAVANGLLTGYEDGQLWPDRPLTRAQMAAISPARSAQQSRQIFLPIRTSRAPTGLQPT